MVELFKHKERIVRLSKLSEDDVRRIRAEYTGRGGVTLLDLADRHGVSRATICLIVNRKKWVHVS